MTCDAFLRTIFHLCTLFIAFLLKYCFFVWRNVNYTTFSLFYLYLGLNHTFFIDHHECACFLIPPVMGFILVGLIGILFHLLLLWIDFIFCFYLFSLTFDFLLIFSLLIKSQVGSNCWDLQHLDCHEKRPFHKEIFLFILQWEYYFFQPLVFFYHKVSDEY